jgi:uncharacterized protein
VRFLLAGASGFLGTALRARLASEGHEVVRLVRREPATGTEFRWRPDQGELNRGALAGVDVAVNLCGAGVADRPWTKRRRALLRSSRLNPGQTLATAVAESDVPLLVQASGIAWYGTAFSSEPHTEESPPGEDFLARLVVDWEASAQPAVDAGKRVVWLRTSPVLDRSGGAFTPMRLAWSAGLGAILGNGRQRMPIISLRDYLAVMEWIVATPEARGPYNLTIPEPATNAEFTTALATELHRPRFLRAPAPVLRALAGDLAEQLLGDNYVIPRRLTDQGFVFTAPDVRTTVRAALDGA